MPQLRTARLTDSDIANTIDNALGAAETDLATILGAVTNTEIAAPAFSIDAVGLKKVILQDAAADPVAVGEIQRNATLVKFHDGTAVQTVAVLANIGSTTNAFGTRTVQAGGAPSGGINGDIFYIY